MFTKLFFSLVRTLQSSESRVDCSCFTRRCCFQGNNFYYTFFYIFSVYPLLLLPSLKRIKLMSNEQAPSGRPFAGYTSTVGLETIRYHEFCIRSPRLFTVACSRATRNISASLPSELRHGPFQFASHAHAGFFSRSVLPTHR